jgi:signal transduction histidine kinase
MRAAPTWKRMPTDRSDNCPLAGQLAERLRTSRFDLTRRWLNRIADRVSISPARVFPSAQLLDHVPLLIEGVADYVESPAAEISTDVPVVAKAMELGALRHQQGFDAYEILKEYELLGAILFSFFSGAAEEIDEPCSKGDLLTCAARLFRAITIIQQATMMHFLRLADELVADREARLEGFNRVLSHEIRNRIGVIMGASDLLCDIDELPVEKKRELAGMIGSNARSMQSAVDNVLVVSRGKAGAQQHRHVRLPQAAQEAARQVRHAAQEARVAVRIAPTIPDVEVDASIVELCLTNYLTNAIKYADPEKSDRYAEIGGDVQKAESGESQVVIRVRDNGLGVPPEKRPRLFERYFRAHETVTGAEGTGLGLSIVRETVEQHGGRAWAEYLSDGSVFVLALPLQPQSSGAESTATVAAHEQRA